MKNYEEKVLNIMNSAKDNIIEQLNTAYKNGYEDAKSELVKKAYKDGYENAKSELGKKVADIAHDERDRAYQKGLEEAWETAKKIITIYKRPELLNMGFKCDGNDYNFSIIVEDYTASEAIAKIKEYEEQQKQFVVGDEVYSDAFDDKGIITHITADKVSCVCIICNGSTMMKVGTNGLHKTGRTFPQIAEVLREMRGEK